MRTIKIILIVLIVIVGLSFVGLIIGGKYLQKNIQKNLPPGLSIDKISIKPFSLSGSNASYKNPESKLKLFDISEININPVFLSLFKRTVKIANIGLNKPEVFIYVTPDGKLIAPWVTMEGKKKEKQAQPQKTIAIDAIQIKNGLLNYSDNVIQNPPSVITISTITSSIKNLQIPSMSSKSPISFNGVIDGGGEISLDGWTDLKTLDSDFALKIKNATINTFQPYIKKSVPVIVDSGTASLTSKIIIQNNKLSMPGTLEIFNLKTRNDSTQQSKILTSQIDSLVARDNGKLKVDFKASGNLSDPDFSLSKVITTAIAKSIGDTLETKLKHGAIEKGKEELKKEFKKH